MSHKKAGGSTRLGRDSISKRLGVKIHDGQKIKAGMVVARQRGTKIHPGKNVKRGNDDTLLALINGIVQFTQKKRKAFNGQLKKTKFANVTPEKQ